MKTITERLKYGCSRRGTRIITDALLYGLMLDLSSFGFGVDTLVYVFSPELMHEFNEITCPEEKYRYTNYISRAISETCSEVFILYSMLFDDNNKIKEKQFFIPFIVEAKRDSNYVIYELHGFAAKGKQYRQFAKDNFTNYRLSSALSWTFFCRNLYRIRINGEDLSFKALSGMRISREELI